VPTPNTAKVFVNRSGERSRLDRLLADARNGASGSLVVRGEAGIGKSALLDDLIANASGCRIARTAGAESEMELAYAGLHQICAPFLGSLDILPSPQRDALAIAFGMRSGTPPDRFLVGLAVLSLLTEIAEAEPLVCLVDDAQWLDGVSAQVLGFVARRLEAEAIVMIFALREPSDGSELAGLPELTLGPLDTRDAGALLASTMRGRLDDSVSARIIAEARGNPLAILELPRAWSLTAIAGGFGLPDSVPVAARIEESYRRRLASLPADSRLLLVVAAAEGVGNPGPFWGAADRLGISASAATAATATGLLEVGMAVRFSHPLVRSVVYRDASPAHRQRVHAALAMATDPDVDPDRRAWHLAAAAPGPDEEVALALEQSAGRAQARGGVGAAAAFLRRSVELTRDPAIRVRRAIAAADVSVQVGAFEGALELAAAAEAAPLDDMQRARLELLRGRIAFASGHGDELPSKLLLRAARSLEPYDLDLARETLLLAWGAGTLTGQLEGREILLEVSRAALALPPLPDSARALDLLLDGLARLTTEGQAAATPTLQRAAEALAEMPPEDVLRWGWMATSASVTVWDIEGFDALCTRQVRLVRDAGALADLPIHLAALGMARSWLGDFAGAEALAAEADSVAAATSGRNAPYALLRLRAMQGRSAEAAPLIKLITAGEPGVAAFGHWAGAVLNNGLARYEDAAGAAGRALNTLDYLVSEWALPELIEAAIRTGDHRVAGEALDRLVGATQPSGTDVALGMEARARALLSDGVAAEVLYREAIERLTRTRLRPEAGRAHLLFGEWLRREGRRIEARDHLRTAYDAFTDIGMEAFAERTRRELLATGETVRRRSVETFDVLTPQELQIARFASDGLTNGEIGAQLFLSRRTVEWHLRKVFDKLEITSRRELRTSLAQEEGKASRH
jgi:DNA-binding NarL/FixJ family response regulator